MSFSMPSLCRSCRSLRRRSLALTCCFMLFSPAALLVAAQGPDPIPVPAPAAAEAEAEAPKHENALTKAFSGNAAAAETAKPQADAAVDPAQVAAPANDQATGFGQRAAQAAGQKMRVLIVANKEATIAGRFYGTISKIHVKESERFKAGQPLVSFDCRELAAERAVAQAELSLHNTTNKANAELYAEKVIGSLEKNLSQAKVGEANAKIKAVSAKMANCSIAAPFDGQVVELQAKAHETLQPGAPIMLIQNSRDLEAHVHVPSTWLAWLKPGATFQTQIEETGSTYQAEVTSVGARVDPVSRTVKIYAKIPGDHPALLPGMSGYAEFKQQ
ncbi:MAG: efflux RND transporter periplasmic adaptor subunit [bacterium]|nr:efflux RND transporter periplasmic adaptor subunit [bacterium]